jgi:hypothetical protein
MPIELAGISNVNEFYSEHYLQTVFEGDVQELRARWREEEKAGGMPADRRLEKAGARWRRLASDYKAERNEPEAPPHLPRVRRRIPRRPRLRA